MFESMEHRWGERVRLELPVRLFARRNAVRAGQLIDLSVSGGAIKVASDLRLLSRVQVAIQLPHRFAHPIPVVPAYVARKCKDGIAVEWCDPSPQPVVELLRWAALRRNERGATQPSSFQPSPVSFQLSPASLPPSPASFQPPLEAPAELAGRAAPLRRGA
jgi:hypothetical protein